MTELSRIEELKRQWLAMMDAVDDSLVILTSDFRIVRQNRAYVNSSVNAGGLSIREFAGNFCYEVFAGRDSPCLQCKLPAALKAGADASWTTNALFPGQDHDIRVHPLPESPDQVVVHYRNITELRTLQEGMARADKLAALGKLAGGVAHEINSPLAGILAFAQMVLKELPESDSHRSDLLEIEDAARKCKVIVEGLLGFARQEQHADDGQSSCDLGQALAATLRLAAPLIRKQRVQLEVSGFDFPVAGADETVGEPQPPAPPLFVRGSSGKLGQVFLNLVTNALYAMKDGGQIALRVNASAHTVTVEVEDTGSGIDPQHLRIIFDPFFTTKPVGDGTGLGLSISYAIVKQYGGHIEVRSVLEQGTVFTVTLPRADGAAQL